MKKIRTRKTKSNPPHPPPPGTLDTLLILIDTGTPTGDGPNSGSSGPIRPTPRTKNHDDLELAETHNPPVEVSFGVGIGAWGAEGHHSQESLKANWGKGR